MKVKSAIILFFTINLSIVARAQDYGCYGVEIPSDNHYAFSTSRFSFVDENWFNLLNIPEDGDYILYHGIEHNSSVSEKIKLKGIIKDGKRFGKWVAISEGGRDSIIGFFKDGEKNGVWKFYKDQEGGPPYLNRMVLYFNGVIDSFDISFNVNGDTTAFISYNKGNKQGISFKRGQYTCYYDNNMLNGQAIVYHNNGKPFYEMTYKNNLPFTLHYVINECGDTIDKGSFKNGSGKLTYYDKTFSLPESIFTFKDQMISGDMIHYNSSQSVFEKGQLYTKYDERIRQEVNLYKKDYNLQAAYQLKFVHPTNYNVFDSNGRINESIIGLDHSDYTSVRRYDVNGNIVSSKFVYGGATVGNDTTFYENGIIKSIIPYQIDSSAGRLTDIKQGKALFYYSLGQLKAELNFDKNKEMGRSIYYDESGKIVKEHFIFRNGSSYSIFNGDTTNKVDSLGRKQGKWFDFSPYFCNRNPDRIEFYKNDKPTDEWLIYSYNGTLFSKTKWINPDSSYAFTQVFYPNGKVSREGYELNSFSIGRWKFYHQKGWLSKEGELTWEGKKGNWVYYNRRGKVKKVVKH